MAWIDFKDPFHIVPGRSGAGSGPWRLTAVTFFDPRFGTSDEIIELLDYLNAFSGNHIDILISGCSSQPPTDVAKSSVIEIRVGDQIQYYSAETLLKDVEQLESVTSWRFSMEIDVVLLNQQRWWNNFNSGIDRDYKHAIVLNVYRMLKDKKITSYSAFFGELITFAKDYAGDNPAWTFSDAKLWKELKSSLFNSFKTYLGFRKFQMRVEDYAVKNIAK